MSSPVTYSRSGAISRIEMDDGKVNAMSIGMLEALHAAFQEAERDKTVVIFSARGKQFSAGFDLKLMANGTAKDVYTLLKLGSEMALRILSFPAPVVSACQANAYAMGAFLVLSSDVRIAADSPLKIGMNEVAIGLAVPRWAVEVARQRLTPAYLNRAAVTGEMFGPAEAVTAGFFDRMVPASELEAAANQTADTLTKIDMRSHTETKMRVREPAIKAIRAAIDADITMAYAEERVAARSAKA
jgi:enoyl-CoA hydratase